MLKLKYVALSLIFIITTGLGYLYSSPKIENISAYMMNFSAGKNHFSFVFKNNGKFFVVFFNHISRKITVHKIIGGNVWSLSPNPSKFGEFYFSYSDDISPEEVDRGKRLKVTLGRCNPEDANCVPVFEFDRSISDVIELDDGKLLFTSGKTSIGGNSLAPEDRSSWFVKTRGFDFFIRTKEGAIQQITEWDALGLGAVSQAAQRIVFRMAPKDLSFKRDSVSDIYSGILVDNHKIADFSPTAPQTFIRYGKNFDTAPFISPDGSTTAILSSSDTINREWRYDIVVLDNSSMKAISTVSPKPGSKFSKPIFVDRQAVRFMSFDGNNYLFHHLDTATGQTVILAQLSINELNEVILQK